MIKTNEIVNYKGLYIYRQEAEVLKSFNLNIEKNLKTEDNHIIEIEIRWGLDGEIKENFCYLTHLKKLTINNCWDSFPINIFDITSLRILALINCRIQSDDLELIGNLINLERLSLYHTNIKDIPKNILKLKKLEFLGISSCRLGQLPTKIGDLQNLCELSLQNNNIKTIPKSLFNLRRLQRLDFYGNKIKLIPKEISFLANLEFLSFWYNEIKELPRTISKLANLNYLNLSKNVITEIPDDLVKLPKLENLDINMPSLEILPMSLLEKVSNYRISTYRVILYVENLNDNKKELKVYLNKKNKTLQKQIYQHLGLLIRDDINDPIEFLYFAENLLESSSSEGFAKFLDDLNPDMFRKILKRPQKTNSENFIEFLLLFYDDLTLKLNYQYITDKFFKKQLFNSHIIEYLNKNLINPEGYLRLSIIEVLDLLEEIKPCIKNTLETQSHKLRMSYLEFGESIELPISIVYILEMLLKILTIEEAIQYLEQYHLKTLQKRENLQFSWMKHENRKVRSIIFDEILNERSIIPNKKNFSNSDYGRFIQTYGDHFLDPLSEHFFIALEKYNRYSDLSWVSIVLNISETMGQKAVDEIINLVIPRNLGEKIPLIRNYLNKVITNDAIYEINTLFIPEYKPNTNVSVQGEIISIVYPENEIIITLRLNNMENLMVKINFLNVSIGDMIMVRGLLIDDKKWGLILKPDKKGVQRWNIDNMNGS
ncbi:hypothetical protein LCGC14_0748970 [marine sediment metagenome]|uniref:Disease resistance R13L4/SHOC-2-like LRR domain-containing protein n=1 Tax=marine sediment metagenome TaxID=412755 RepID=A0A0F9SPM1_9ZZZZ